MVAGAASKAAGLGLVAKIGLGASLAAAGVASAGAAGMLPAAANHAVRDAIETVTPLGSSDSGGDKAPDRFGERVSSDAKGESDGEHGVDGREISEEAPGAAHRSDHSQPPDDPPGQSGETGLTRANQTPAAPHVPDTPPSTVPSQVGGNGPAPVPSTVPAHGGPADDHTPDG